MRSLMTIESLLKLRYDETLLIHIGLILHYLLFFVLCLLVFYYSFVYKLVLFFIKHEVFCFFFLNASVYFHDFYYYLLFVLINLILENVCSAAVRRNSKESVPQNEIHDAVCDCLKHAKQRLDRKRAKEEKRQLHIVE